MTTSAARHPLIALLPLWLFVLFFKFGGALHYTMLSPLGEQVLPVWVVGAVVGGASLLQLLLDVPAGMILDRFGYVRLLRIGTALFTCAAAVFFLFELTPASFVLSVLIATFGWLFFGPGMYAYILAEAPAKDAGAHFGLFHTFDSLGVVFATLMLTFALGLGAQWVGWMIAVLLVIALVWSWGIPHETCRPVPEHKVRGQRYYIRRHFLHHVWGVLGRLNPASAMLVIHSFSSSAFYGTIWFVVPLVIAKGTHEGLLGVSLSVFDLAVVLLGSFFGYCADRFDKKRLIFLGLLLFSAAGMALGFNFNLWFLLLGFLATAGDELSGVALWAWLDHLDKSHAEDGLVNGAISFFEDLGWTVGPILAGALFGVLGPSWTVAASALLLLATWAISTILMRRYAPPRLAVASDLRPHRARHKN